LSPYPIQNCALSFKITNYVYYFGIDNNISGFLEKFKVVYPDSEIELEQLEQGSLETWQPTMIVNSILD
jgi:hypothetical protein